MLESLLSSSFGLSYKIFKCYKASIKSFVCFSSFSVNKIDKLLSKVLDKISIINFSIGSGIFSISIKTNLL